MYNLLTLMIGNINVLLIIMYGWTSLSNSLNLYLKHVFDLPIKTDETPSCRHSGCFVLCKMDKKRIAKSFCLGIQMKKSLRGIMVELWSNALELFPTTTIFFHFPLSVFIPCCALLQTSIFVGSEKCRF